MANCRICGRNGCDRHHIIHRCENGLDAQFNLVDLCPAHHRGPHGVHNNPELDLHLKIEMQKKLEDMFPKRYYTAEEIRDIADLRYSQIRKFEKGNRLHKYGYDRNDIIFYLMGGNTYRYDYLDDLSVAQSY